mgnify:CR=1 FL=1
MRELIENENVDYTNLFIKPTYQLSDEEHDNIQSLLNKLREEVVSPLLKDTTDLIKEINKIESKHSGLPDIENQIEYQEEIFETEVIDKNQIEDKSE